MKEGVKGKFGVVRWERFVEPEVVWSRYPGSKQLITVDQSVFFFFFLIFYKFEKKQLLTYSHCYLFERSCSFWKINICTHLYIYKLNCSWFYHNIIIHQKNYSSISTIKIYSSTSFTHILIDVGKIHEITNLFIWVILDFMFDFNQAF